MSRRFGPPEGLLPWPSFVDALSSALVVLVFVVVLLSIRSGKVLESIQQRAATSEAQASITEAIARAVETEGVTVVQAEGRLRILLPEVLLFQSGEAEVSPAGRAALLTLAERLRQLPGEIEVEGHTDDRPITGALAGRFPTNWELSTARATAVVRILQEEGGIPGGRLSGQGHGPFRPIEPNDTEAGRAANRRIELVVTPAAAEEAP